MKFLKIIILISTLVENGFNYGVITMITLISTHAENEYTACSDL